MKNQFESASISADKLDAILGKLKLHQVVANFIRDKILNLNEYPKWIKHDRVLYMVTMSDGNKGIELLNNLEYRGFDVSIPAKSMISSESYISTDKVFTVVAILDGRLFSNRSRTSAKVCMEAKKRKLNKLEAENACLLRMSLTNKHLEFMGFSRIVVMHNPIKDLEGSLRLFNVSRALGGMSITARSDEPKNNWTYDSGFAFELFKINLRD